MSLSRQLTLGERGYISSTSVSDEEKDRCYSVKQEYYCESPPWPDEWHNLSTSNQQFSQDVDVDTELESPEEWPQLALEQSVVGLEQSKPKATRKLKRRSTTKTKKVSMRKYRFEVALFPPKLGVCGYHLIECEHCENVPGVFQCVHCENFLSANIVKML